MEKQKLYSERVRGFSRTYFFDVRPSTNNNGGPFLTVSESQKDKEREGEYKTNSILISSEDADAFLAALSRTVENLHANRLKSKA